MSTAFSNTGIPSYRDQIVSHRRSFMRQILKLEIEDEPEDAETDVITDPFVELKVIMPDISSNDLTALPQDALIWTRLPPRHPKLFMCQVILFKSTIDRLINVPCNIITTGGYMANSGYEMKSDDDFGRYGTRLIKRGIVAKRTLDVGTLLFAESPLIVMPSNRDLIYNGISDVSVLQGSDIANMDNLSIMEPIIKAVYKELRWSDLFKTLLNERLDKRFPSGIWATNCIPCGALDQLYSKEDEVIPNFQAVSKQVSRMNHRCAPNCSVLFDLDSFTLQVHVTKPIGKGQEIFLSHISPFESAVTHERQGKLSFDRGLKCACSVCTNDYDEWIADIKKWYVKFRTGVLKWIAEGKTFTYEDIRLICLDTKEVSDYMLQLRLDGLYEYKGLLDMPILAARHLGLDVTEQEKVTIEHNIEKWKVYIAPYEKAWKNYFTSD